MNEEFIDILMEKCSGLALKVDDNGDQSYEFEFNPEIDTTTIEGKKFVKDLLEFLSVKSFLDNSDDEVF